MQEKPAPAPFSTLNAAPAATYMFESAVKLAPCTTRIVPFETSRPPVVAETAFENTNSRAGSSVSQLMPTLL